MSESLAYAALRTLTCGIWLAAGLYKLAHWHATVAEMRHHRIPCAHAVLVLVIALELAGSLLVITNTHVWAVALAWIAFTIPASAIYHARFVTPAGIDFVQYVLFWEERLDRGRAHRAGAARSGASRLAAPRLTAGWAPRSSKR